MGAIQQMFGFGQLGVPGGDNVMALPGNEGAKIGQRLRLPQTAGVGAITKSAGEAAYLKQQGQQLQRLSRYELQRAQALANIHGIRSRHQQGMARVQERVAQTNLQHQMAAGNHSLTMKETDAQQRGFVAAMNAASAELW
ncbi:MAG: hypothetical protein HC771_13135 [Synechococcales cyanobacterium CRU_2_2]|nr:hypothetical protein [Synechococcales cyanobacterium CRU_2_2]